MYPQNSILLSNLERFLTLEANERQLLRNLEGAPYRVSRNAQLWEEGARIDQLFLLHEGWACTYHDNPEGERQVMDVLLPGNIAGLRDFTLPQHFTAAAMITEGKVASISYRDVGRIVHASPRLAIALFAAAARQEALITQRMAVGFYRDARAQLTHFILEIHARLNKLMETPLDRFDFPVSQQMLGYALGLTNVHVNRVFTRLEADGVLKKHRQHIEVLDQERLREEAQFDGAYLDDSLDGLGDYLGHQDQAVLWGENSVDRSHWG